MKQNGLDNKQKAVCFVVYTMMSAAAAWLLYDSLYAMFVFMPFYFLFQKAVSRAVIKKQKEQLTDGFIRALVNISASIFAGLSPENAFAACAFEMEKMYGKRAQIVKELEEINLKVAAGGRLTEALDDFAVRARIPEISDFSVVFGVAKENGSDFPAVISECVSVIESRRRAEQDARILIRSRQYEQRLMFIIWPGILLYLRLSSGNFIDVLYHSPFGATVMSASIVIFVLAVWLAEKMGDVSI